MEIKVIAVIVLGVASVRVQSVGTSRGDPALEAQITRKPTADALSALGVYFANRMSPVTRR
jgi:hypothetical protein